MEDLINRARRKVVGTKQTLKALEQGEVARVFIAADAESQVTRPVALLCREQGIEPDYVDTMAELGLLFGIKVKAATAAIIE